MSPRDVEISLNDKKILNSADIQGSLLKVIYENNVYSVLFFEVGFLISRYRLSHWQINEDRIATTVGSGRSMLFLVIVDGINISYEPVRLRLSRSLTELIAQLLVWSSVATYGTYRTITRIINQNQKNTEA